MTIYGVSQSSGVERRLQIERGGEGAVLILTDHAGNKERERILVKPEDLLNAITDSQEGGMMVEGRSVPHGAQKTVHVEVRRNEVVILVRGSSGEGTDVAVGLDDFQDGLEGALARG